MILQALTEYYEQLLEQGEISQPGWENKFKVSFFLDLDTDGNLVDVKDCRTSKSESKKDAPKPMELSVPAHVKRTVGIAANFLCDNSTYLLGADEKGKPKRAKECFDACAALHHTILDDVEDPAAKAILTFFDCWQPEKAAEHPLIAPLWKDISGNANLLFRIETEEDTVMATAIPALKAAWQHHYSSSESNAPTVQCLVTGKQAPPARLHPSIKGVPGAQSSGAALVSFNAPAFCSYGHEQGENAPVSEYAAFAYTTALNHLLNSKDHHLSPTTKAVDTAKYLSQKEFAPRSVIGDTVFVYWSEKSSSAVSAIMNCRFSNSEDTGISDQDLQYAIKSLAEGKPCSFLEQELSPQQHVYILGLSPNAARISVRFFLRDTLGVFAKRLDDHAEALRIVRPAFDKRENLSIWALTRETVNPNSKNPTPSPQLVGDLVRAILTGCPYPATLLNGVEQRIRADRKVTRGRAAILKAYYKRANTLPQEVLTMDLNEQSNYTPYVLGRLFAVLEAVQETVSPDINATIHDRYFSSACATPSVVYPTLINLAQNHLSKLKKTNLRAYIFYSNQITDLMCKFTQTYPTRMSQEEQGAFQIGYYHQTQKRFAKKNEEE